MVLNEMNLHEVLDDQGLVDAIIDEVRGKFNLQAGHWPEVYKEPLFWGRLGRSRIEGKYALIDRAQEGGHYFNVCSDDYLIVPYELIVKMAADVAEQQAEVFGPAQFKLLTYKDGGRFKMEAVFPETGAKIKDRPNVAKYVVYSSLDLGRQFMRNWGWGDLVCSNGMILWKSKNHFRIKHIQTLGEQNIAKDMNHFLETFGETTGILQKWAETKLSEKVYNQIWEDLTEPKNKVFSVAQREKIEALPIIGGDGVLLEMPKKTLFDLQLAASQFVTHELKSEVRRDDISENLGRVLSRYAH